jgi:hypothetical protein
MFLTLLISKESSALYSFFNDHRMGDQFMDLLSEDDKEYLTEKNRRPVLELWLEYLYDTNILAKKMRVYT